jgi:hypothetical protein
MQFSCNYRIKIILNLILIKKNVAEGRGYFSLFIDSEGNREGFIPIKLQSLSKISRSAKAFFLLNFVD